MWKGSLVALATPFDAQNRIDYEALQRLIDFHVEQGSEGLVIAGTTGESATLSQPEHVELVRAISDEHVPDLGGAEPEDEDEEFKVPDDLVW